jgi:hypothetical protein
MFWSYMGSPKLVGIDSGASSNLLAAAHKLLNSRRIHDALHTYDSAQLHGWPLRECAAGRWMCWMLLGEFERAWRESDAIEASGAGDSDRLWDGLPFDQKRVIVRTLHGYGDAIQFIRYVPLLRRRADKVLVETHPELVSIMASLEGVDEVLTWPESPSTRKKFDQEIEVMELPRAFRTQIHSIPCYMPYLKPHPDTVTASRRHLDLGTGLNIGLIWASSKYDTSRSMRLEDLIPVLSNTNINFYSFQHGPERAQLIEFKSRFTIHDTVTHSTSVMETAADLTNMDLVISVDTFAAHLAGALNRRVWLMLPYAADWRWMLHREDSPWYPSMRLFRQCTAGDWLSVVYTVAQELGAFNLAGAAVPCSS